VADAGGEELAVEIRDLRVERADFLVVEHGALRVDDAVLYGGVCQQA